MDNPLTEPDASGAIIAYANDYQFKPGERIRYPQVHSRMFLWNIRGRGSVSVNGRRHLPGPGEYLFTPWKHEIAYEADERDPFKIGAVHLIPCQKPGSRVEYRVSHHPGQRPQALAGRSDAAWPGIPALLHGRLDEGPLERLVSCIVAVFHRDFPGRHHEPTQRDLARLLVRELWQAARLGPVSEGALPRALRVIRLHLREHPGEPVSIASMAQRAACSPATVHRLFRQFLKVSPHEYVSGLRMREARRLLRTTTLAVRRIGERVGFSDAFHFSRFFKQREGVSPRGLPTEPFAPLSHQREK